MLFAAIDIGSNAARLLFANAYDRNGVIQVDKASLTRIPTRLGEDVYKDNRISKERVRDFVKTMKAFKLLIDVYKPQTYSICATAAMREAENREEIIKKVKKETGMKIKVIDGRQEANLIRSTNRVIVPTPKPYLLFMDVGGGSTELSIEKDGQLLKLKSFKLGTLRLLSNKVNEKVWNEIRYWLNEYKADFQNFHIIGTGGNINKISKVFGEEKNQMLSKEVLEQAYVQLRDLTIEERIEQFGFRTDRADVIVPAAFIYLHVMKHIGAPYVLIPRIGLVDGLIFQQFKEFKSLNKL